MKTIQSSSLLKFALFADAAVSGAVAALQLLLTRSLADLLQLPYSLLLETGVFLLGYVALLLVLARAPRLWSSLIGVVVLGNVGWAVACVGLLTTGAVVPNVFGTGFISMQAAAVLVFAGLEFRGLQSSLADNRVAVAR